MIASSFNHGNLILLDNDNWTIEPDKNTFAYIITKEGALSLLEKTDKFGFCDKFTKSIILGVGERNASTVPNICCNSDNCHGDNRITVSIVEDIPNIWAFEEVMFWMNKTKSRGVMYEGSSSSSLVLPQTDKSDIKFVSEVPNEGEISNTNNFNYG